MLIVEGARWTALMDIDGVEWRCGLGDWERVSLCALRSGNLEETVLTVCCSDVRSFTTSVASSIYNYT